nr:AAA-ATPase At3g50940-like [Tanacetum cinerariifolium]
MPLNSLDSNPNPKPNDINKPNRVQIPNASYRHPSSYVASFAAFAMLTRSVANDVLTVGKEFRALADEFIPREYQDYYLHEMKKIILNNDSQFTVVIDEYQPQSNVQDEMFKAVETYLTTKVNESCVRKINVCKNKENLSVKLNENEEIFDEFDGVQVKWSKIGSSYELTFHNRHRFMILESYLPYVLEQSDAIKSEESGLKFHMIDDKCHEPKTVILDNPMTFKTLAIEPELKKSIIEDLNNFKNGKEYYRRIGKAWKRGYLIHGPSGTGKSSLISSIANYLNYDVYDIDLSNVDSDSQLKNILLEIPSKSILVFEDFDECQNVQNRKDTFSRLLKFMDGMWSCCGEERIFVFTTKYFDECQNVQNRKDTFSRLLKFMDGMWSCCGEERIFVFTTKCIDNVDYTLLRPGRMDMHIHMPYCTFPVFKQLAFNYLDIEDHRLFERIDELLEYVNVTPAEVAGELMKCTRDPTLSLERLVAYLER